MIARLHHWMRGQFGHAPTGLFHFGSILQNDGHSSCWVNVQTEQTTNRFGASSPVEMDWTTNVSSVAELDDSALIRLVLAGETDYFGLLMDRHLATVKGRIQWMTRSAQDVEDIMQEVQLKVWKNLRSFRSEASFRTWVTSVATNETLQFYRKKNRALLVDDPRKLEVLESPADSPFQAHVRRELAETVRAAVQRLPSKYKEVLVLRGLQELSLREICQELQATMPAVKTRVFRARAALSEVLLIHRSHGLAKSREFSKKRAGSRKLAAQRLEAGAIRILPKLAGY
jgi:RNA polymerase sigma-70 factor, ECF subfamily